MASRIHTLRTFDADLAVEPLVSPYRFVIGGLVALLAFSGGLSFFATGPITPLIIDHYDVSHSAASLLTGLAALVHVVLALPVSMLVGRVGLKKLITLGSLGVAAPLFSFLASDSFAFLLALRAVYGLGFLVLFPASGPLFMQWFRPSELPVANGVFIVMASLGIATSTFIVAPLSDATGWEVALSVFGGVSLVATLAWLAFGRTGPVEQPSESPSALGRVWDVLRSRTTLLVALADAGPLTFLTVSLAWLPTYYNDVHGFSLAKAGTLMGLLSAAGVVALVLASLLSLRTRRRRPFLVFPGVLIGFAALGAFLLADSLAVYLAVVALGFAAWFYLPALVTIPMELYPHDPARVSVIFAVLMATGGLASFIGPLTVGALFDVTGSFVPGLAIFAVLSWSLAITGLLLPETGAQARGHSGRS